MVSVCCYLLGSCTAHLFNCISEHARHVCFYFDYAAISLYSVGAAIAYRQYVFPNEMIGGWYYSLFHYIAAFNSVVCTTMACTSRFGNREILKKILRLSAFAYPYVFDSIPLVIRLTSCHSNDCWDESYELHARQFFLAFITASFFASHFPECIAPGMFDVIGHSHQLFHICGALATNTQLNALMLDMENRREFFEQHDAMPTFFSSLGLFGIVIIMNLIIVAIFSYFRKYPLVFKEMTGSALYRIASSAQLFALNNNNNKKSL
ncbi:membrane progestin receptor gamma-B-like [Saccoglossus kowalevskii]